MTFVYAQRDGIGVQRSSGVLRSAILAPCYVHGCEGLAVAPTPQNIAQQPGLPLDGETRTAMEDRFGYDFTRVRVHADKDSAASAWRFNALAYSLGPHLAFGAKQYAPGTAAGKRLLAHELAHVVQQDASAPSGPPLSAAGTNLGGALEDEAERAADAAVSGRAAKVRRGVAADAGTPLRQAAAPAPAAPRKPQREERFSLGRGAHRVDAELDRSIGWLTVKMKVKFNQTSTPRPWPSPARFTQFQSDFIRTVAERWSFKHYLVPETACADEPPLVVVRVQVIPVTSGQHFTLNVGYATAYQQSSVQDRSSTLDVLDISQRSDIPQTPGEHEFGHMLGLPHIHCATNAPDCYGTTSEERADIMGEGSFVSPRDYEPFAELMPYFTGCNYRVRQASYIPTSRAPEIGGAIGFLLGGIGSGLAGAEIGSLLGPVGAVVGGLIGLVGGAIGGYFAGRAVATPRVPS